MTVTSNIHYNLLAWAASTAYLVGLRVSNGGNAYSCITTGTSAASGGPTGTGASITDGTVFWKWLSIIDYTTIPLWWTGIPTTLTQPIIGLLWRNGGNIATPVNLLTTSITLTGKTTTAVNNVTLQAAPGESWVDNIGTNPYYYNPTNGVAITSSVSANATFVVNQQYTVFSGLQIENTSATGGSIHNTNKFTLDGCILRGVGNDPGYLAGGAAIRNCLIIYDTNTAGPGIRLDSVGVMINSTVVRPSNRTAGGTSFVAAYGTSIVRNTAIFGFTVAPTGTFNTDGHNASNNAASTPGTTGNITTVPYNTTTFVQPDTSLANPDFRLVVGSTLKDAGVTDVVNLPASVDAFRTSRPQGSAWDIGAFEVLQAGGVSTFSPHPVWA